MRRIFIGDVHGCLQELQELIQTVNPQPVDELVFVGDLIHKGPDSAGVLRYVQKLKNQYTAHVICGNHEEKHLRWLRAEERRLRTGAPNLMQHVEKYGDLKITTKAHQVMSDTYLARSYGEYTAVHAGIPGDLEELHYLSHNQWLQLRGKLKHQQAQVMRCRFISPEGRMIGLGKQTKEDSYWAETYDGRFGTIVFGHNPFVQDRPKIFPHAIGIDLSCVHGGYLCALIVENKTLKWETVKARTKYMPRPSWVYDK